nr:uncharacterized protein LOC129464215 [Symphalangus syndactylus]
MSGPPRASPAPLGSLRTENPDFQREAAGVGPLGTCRVELPHTQGSPSALPRRSGGGGKSRGSPKPVDGAMKKTSGFRRAKGELPKVGAGAGSESAADASSQPRRHDPDKGIDRPHRAVGEDRTETMRRILSLPKSGVDDRDEKSRVFLEFLSSVPQKDFILHKKKP